MSKSEPIITSLDDEKTTQSKTSTEKEPEKSSFEGQLSKLPVFNKAPLSTKPVPAEKPLVLPKPTLLVKPDSPMSFG